MDEPTSSLTHVETQTLHEMIRALRKSGTTIVYVSHFLDEVLELCRHGHRAAQRAAGPDGPGGGRDGVEPRRRGCSARPSRPSTSRSPSTRAARWCWRCGAAAVKEFSTTSPSRSAQGEIVGLAGLVGSGRTELARAIAGADPIDAGTIRVDGAECRIRSPRDAIAAGIAFVPESRKKDGLFMELSLAANTTFAHMRSVSSKLGFVRPIMERSRTRALLQSLSVEPPSPSARVGKPLRRQPAEGPLRPLAVQGAARADSRRADARRRRRCASGHPPSHHDLAAQGAAILMISSELEEVLGLAHRVLVMRRGTIVRRVRRRPGAR